MEKINRNKLTMIIFKLLIFKFLKKYIKRKRIDYSFIIKGVVSQKKVGKHCLRYCSLSLHFMLYPENDLILEQSTSVVLLNTYTLIILPPLNYLHEFYIINIHVIYTVY